ncbi:desulfoferrodoxin [Deltaproteobacteria bacterium Smac51]|nr:desulfoferrodoxin [Deltaproteobacteria bacterium Smac51]
MAETKIFKCEECGNIIEVLHDAGGPVACCGKPAKLMEANTVDAAQEKHVPVIEKIEGGYRVKVGSVAHPMEEKHYIMWIELLTDDGMSMRKFLKPGDQPVAEFKTDSAKVTAREYCNLHGLWKAAN